MLNGLRLLSYVQLLDSALPIGGFAHSFGLETGVQNGAITTVNHLESYIEGQIQSSLVPFEGLVIKGCYESITKRDIKQLCKYDEIVHIQRTPRESREGLLKMGRRLMLLAKTLYPWMEFKQLEHMQQQNQAYFTLATMHAWINYQLEIPIDDAAKGYIYTAVVNQVNSALRLMAVGQTESQAIIARMLPVIEREWSAVAHLPPDRLHTFSIAQEIYAMNHEPLYSRLFMS